MTEKAKRTVRNGVLITVISAIIISGLASMVKLVGSVQSTEIFKDTIGISVMKYRQEVQSLRDTHVKDMNKLDSILLRQTVTDGKLDLLIEMQRR